MQTTEIAVGQKRNFDHESEMNHGTEILKKALRH